MKIQHALSILLICLAVLPSSACECLPSNFTEAVQSSERIVVGRVLSRDGNHYEVLILKEWFNGRISLDEEVTINFRQNDDGCYRRNFQEGEVYLFYFENGAVHNCSRTTEFYRAADVDRLDELGQLHSLYNDAQTSGYDSLDYRRTYILTDANGVEYDLRNKQILYISRKEIFTDQFVPLSYGTSFHPTRFYPVNAPFIEGVDQLFYVHWTHQERIVEESVPFSRKTRRRVFKFLKNRK